MATTYNAKGKVFLTKSQFDARKAAGTLQTGIEYMITDSDYTPYDDSLKGIIDGSITELVIPEGTTAIRNQAFSYCSSLTSITIPDSVTSIGTSALQCGSSTNKATFTFTRTTPPTIQSNTFEAAKISKIIVPAGCSSAYKAATNWSSFASYIEEATV